MIIKKICRTVCAFMAAMFLVTLSAQIGCAEEVTSDNTAVATVTTDGITDSYTDIGEAWVAALKASKEAPTTIKLYADWIAPNGSFYCEDEDGDEYGTWYGRLHMATSSMELTIDLNGYKIDRNLSDYTEHGQVFRIEAGSLTIADTSTAQTGKITGGYNDGDGGGFYIDGGSLTINGGAVSGNRCIMDGGGIYFDSSNAITINGGKITENFAENGGGIAIFDGTLNLTAGEISINTASYCGGGFHAVDTTVNMTGGSILKNKADGISNISGICESKGGGVYLNGDTNMYMSGGSISENTSSDFGGGVYGSFEYVQSGNSGYEPGQGSNLYITGGAVTDNVAFNQNGGGIYWESVEKLMIADATITGNSTTFGNGGGVYCPESANYVILGGVVKIIDNTSQSANPDNPASNIYITGTDRLLYNASGQFNTPVIPMEQGSEVGISVSYDIVSDGKEISGYSSKFTMDCTSFFVSDSELYETRWEFDGSYYRMKLAELNQVDTPYMEVSTGGVLTLYSEPDEGWIAALKASKEAPTTIKLYADWIAPNGSFYCEDEDGDEYGTDKGRLHMATSSMDLTIDLNGHTISRNLTTSTEHGQVFRIEAGSLTIADTSEDKTGKITGGYNDGDGGAFYIDEGNLCIKGGEITQNRCSGKGAGIYWNSDGILCLTGGKITSNTARLGGAVYVASDEIYVGGTIYIDGNTNLNGDACNIYLPDGDHFINQAAGQKTGVADLPLEDGASLGVRVLKEKGLISGESSSFDENSFSYFTADDVGYHIRAIYDEGKYILYYVENDSTSISMPEIVSASVKNTELITEAVLNADEHTITLKAVNSTRSNFESVSLDSLITYTPSLVGEYIVKSNEAKDLRSPCVYAVANANGYYTLYEVKIEWPDCTHIDEDGDTVCDACEEYFIADFAITDYNDAERNVTVEIPTAGSYTLIIVDYENGRLAGIELKPITAEKAGSITVKVSLIAGDKLMLWSDTVNCKPKCASYIIE